MLDGERVVHEHVDPAELLERRNAASRVALRDWSVMSVGTATARRPSATDLRRDLVEIRRGPCAEPDVRALARERDARSRGPSPGPTPETIATLPSSSPVKPDPALSSGGARRRPCAAAGP